MNVLLIYVHAIRHIYIDTILYTILYIYRDHSSLHIHIILDMFIIVRRDKLWHFAAASCVWIIYIADARNSSAAGGNAAQAARSATLGWDPSHWRKWCCHALIQRFDTRTHTRAHTRMHTRTHAHTRAHTHVCVWHVRARTHTRAHTHTCTNVGMPTFVHVCAHVHSRACMCAHTYTVEHLNFDINWMTPLHAQTNVHTWGHTHTYTCTCMKCIDTHGHSHMQIWHVLSMSYGVPTISRLFKIIGLFCRISSLL